MDKLTEMLLDEVSTYDECWKQAPKTIEGLNKGFNLTIHDEEPVYSFDCNFKLDYDGSLIKVLSRFYRPQHFGSLSNPKDIYWSGDICVFSLGKEISRKPIKATNLNELKVKVKEHMTKVYDVLSRLEKELSSI